MTAIGSNCFVATLIAAGKFPPPANVLQTLPTTSAAESADHDHDDNDHDVGVSLVQSEKQQQETSMVRETF